MTSVSAKSTPSLGRYLPVAALFSFGIYAAVVGFLFLTPEQSSGAGGEVVGQLSVSLGGSGAAGQPQQTPTEPILETSSVPPTPRLERQRLPVVQPVARAAAQPQRVVAAEAPKSRVVQSEQVVDQPAEIPRVSAPEQTLPSMAPQTGEQGDGNPVGSASAGTPSLGEGAASESAGIGSADARAGDQRDAYLAMIRRRIEENRTYPSAARRRREEGMATLAISIDGQGNLSRIEIIAGAGSFHLDRAAKRMVEKSAPFPTPPVTPFATTIPIVFALR